MSDSIDAFGNLFDLREQHLIRGECRVLAEQLSSDENERLFLLSDLECIITHYCKRYVLVGAKGHSTPLQVHETSPHASGQGKLAGTSAPTAGLQGSPGTSVATPGASAPPVTPLATSLGTPAAPPTSPPSGPLQSPSPARPLQAASPAKDAIWKEHMGGLGSATSQSQASVSSVNGDAELEETACFEPHNGWLPVLHVLLKVSSSDKRAVYKLFVALLHTYVPRYMQSTFLYPRYRAPLFTLFPRSFLFSLLLSSMLVDNLTQLLFRCPFD